LPSCVTIIAFVPDVKIPILQLRHGAGGVIIFEAVQDLEPLSMSNSSRSPPLPACKFIILRILAVPTFRN